MSSPALSREVPASRGRASSGLFQAIPIWAIAVFCGAIAVAYSPNVFDVVGIHNDYEMLYYKNPHFFHPEAEHLFAIARPIAALFTNLTILPLQSMADYRWVRLFSILTVCVLGTQMIGNCIVHLRTRTWDALAVAIAVFLVPSFTYSVLNAAAWTPHLLTLFIALAAYTVLSRSNLQSISFIILAARHDYSALCSQVWAYFRSRSAWNACLIYQLALYDYPPNALILTVFPVIAVLFSPAPRAYRSLIALRDIVFIGANLVLYFLSAKLIYIPFVRLFTSVDSDVPVDPNQSAFAARLSASYHFNFDSRLGEIFGRLGHLTRVTGDLWFLPQARIHVLTGAVLLLAAVSAGGMAFLAWRRAGGERSGERASPARLLLKSWCSEAVITGFVLATCFVISASPILLPAGGFVSYRTIAVPTALTAIVVIYALRRVTETIGSGIVNSSIAASRIADAVAVLTVFTAFAAIFYDNYITMKLARNEFAYFTGIARQALDNKSKAIFIVDPRPFMFPEDIPIVYDQHGRALPPYELGCFSGYCLQTGAILRIAIEELGYSGKEFTIVPMRGDDPVPGLACEMLTAPTPFYPPNASTRSVSIIHYYRSLAPLTCVDYSLAWHDLGANFGR